MLDLSRREALRLGAMGLSGLIAGPAVAGCGTSSATSTVAATNVSDKPGQVLAPFDSTLPAGPATGLSRRVAWANTADIDIFIQLANGIAAAAADSGLGYLTADCDGDPQTNVDQIDTFLARGIGGMTIQPLDAAAQTPVMLKALSQGVCVIGIITNPCTLQIAASQYPIGYQQGKAAADYVTTHLKGKATVFLQNQGPISPQLQLRTNGVLAGLRTGGPGITVLDTYVTPVEYGTVAATFQYFTTELQRQPTIDVVLGDDSFVLAAYRAIEQAGRLREEMYFSGVDGDRGSLELIRKGTPYRASLAFAWPLMGYGMGRFTADWIDGKQIPRIMVAKTTLVDSPAAAATFEADNADLAGTFADREKYEKYLPLLGNVSYADRHTFWNLNYVPR